MLISKEKHVSMMPTTQKWAQWLEKYLKDKEGEVGDYTIHKYRRDIGRILRMLCDAGMECEPSKIGRRDIQYLLLAWKEMGLSQNYKIWLLNHLNLVLNYYGNSILKKMHIRLKSTKRTHVRWLSVEEVERIWAAAEQLGPQYEIRIHLGLDLCLRKVEMFRLHVWDFEFYGNGRGKIHVLGKGKFGGKPADLPFHPDTEYYLKKYLEWREEQFMKAESRGEKIREEARDALLIWYQKEKGIGKEHYTTMDNRIAKISRLAGVKFSHHDLRRTGASINYWVAQWDIVNVQHLLRHEKLETTIQYLGLDYDLLEQAMWAHKRGGKGEMPHLPTHQRNNISVNYGFRRM